MKTEKEVGFRISCEKTKTMIIGQQMHTPIKIGQQDVECVEHFQYLGSYICRDGDATVDVRARIAKAASVFQRLRPIWSSKSINMSVKLRLYTSIVMPTATYAGETWKTTVEIANKLNVFHRRCLRTILGISWRDHVTNEEVLKRAGMENLQDIVRKRRWKFAGHILRLPQERIASTAMSWTPENGNRKSGRPKKTWRSTFQEDLREKNVSWSGVRRVASDRKRWKSLVAQCSGRSGCN
jgi:hypothetical protein